MILQPKGDVVAPLYNSFTLVDSTYLRSSTLPTMSGAPPDDDTRPLPYGWIKQWNSDYAQYFYVRFAEAGVSDALNAY